MKGLVCGLTLAAVFIVVIGASAFLWVSKNLKHDSQASREWEKFQTIAAKIREVSLAEKTARYSKAVAAFNPHAEGLALHKCEASTTASILPLADSNARVLVCHTQLGNGMVGAVFEGVLLCPDHVCSQRFDAKSVDSDALNLLQRLVPENSRHALEQLHAARKVAVKFATKNATEGKQKNSLGEVLYADMNKEIKNLQKIQSDMVVQYLGRINDDPQFKGEVFPSGSNGMGTTEEQTLVSPGLVMEYLDGPTVLWDILNNPPDLTQLVDRFNCYLAQMILIFGEEVTTGVINKDFHINNAIVLEKDSSEFTLNSSLKCKKINMIDYGSVVEITDLESTIVSLLNRVMYNMALLGSKDLAHEIAELLAKMLTPLKTEARPILVKISNTRSNQLLPTIATAVLTALNDNTSH